MLQNHPRQQIREDTRQKQRMVAKTFRRHRRGSFHSKFAHNIPNIYNNKIILKPSDKKAEVLGKIFPTNLLAKILSMISMEQDADATSENLKTFSKMSISSRIHKFKMDSEESCSANQSEQGSAKAEIEKGFERFLVLFLNVWFLETLQVPIIPI